MPNAFARRAVQRATLPNAKRPSVCPSTRGIGLSADTRFSTATNLTQDSSANLRWDVTERVGLLFDVQYDDSQSIGKRYRRQDEIGTPFCVTFDFDSLVDKKVTIRHRDTMKQDRVDLSQVTSYLANGLRNF